MPHHHIERHLGEGSVKDIIAYTFNKLSATEEIRKTVLSHVDDFVKWPKMALLLWEGCTRENYHKYPVEILALLKEKSISRRNWGNDPAVNSFLIAGGERPQRNHKKHGWNIHHLYFGVHAHGVNPPLHAVKEAKHFTQSAGLIAVHPIADALCEEDSEFARLLCRQSFNRFGYDPNGIFLRLVMNLDLLLLLKRR